MITPADRIAAVFKEVERLDREATRGPWERVDLTVPNYTLITNYRTAAPKMAKALSFLLAVIGDDPRFDDAKRKHFG